DAAPKNAAVSGPFAEIPRGGIDVMQPRKGRKIPMNIDGPTAVIYSALGFSPAPPRGLSTLSRSAGILGHAGEQSQQGGRIKGPMPPGIPYRYTGPAPRDFAK